MDTVERGEMVEKELDALISRRHDKRVASKGERALEEAWAESERSPYLPTIFFIFEPVWYFWPLGMVATSRAPPTTGY